MRSGRPSKYKDDTADKVLKMAMLGLTQEQMATVFDISESTFKEWKKKYPEFSAALKEGKTEADAVVAHSLFKRARGYAHPDTDIRVIDNKIVKTKIIKHYPPDTGAAMAWLKNRQPELWREKRDESLVQGKPIHITYERIDSATTTD